MVNNDSPLAVRVRPTIYEEFIGQKHVLGEGKLLRRAIKSRRVPSLIFWGPAGCGKTTLGFILAKELGASFEYLNAAFSSVSEVKKIIKKAKEGFEKSKEKTVVFIDEFHRFNKLQQESLVPDTEEGNIIFIGTTIYRPFYYIISSIISRSIVAEFKPLTKDDIILIMKRALKDKEKGLGGVNIKVTNKALEYISVICGGDARSALTALEIGVFSTSPNQEGEIVYDLEVATESIQKKSFYDRADKYHYDTISAFIKSIRGSDVDSALYWLAKMLRSGEDIRFIGRRLTILASEDIGNANPSALVVAVSCFKAIEFVGRPEADLILAQATIYLASSPKSNSAYLAIKKAKEDVEGEETKEVPQHLKTHSEQYKYPHSYGGYVEQNYGVAKRYYLPKDIGEEKKIKKFLEELREKKGQGSRNTIGNP
jgi:putative ATPase